MKMSNILKADLTDDKGIKINKEDWSKSISCYYVRISFYIKEFECRDYDFRFFDNNLMMEKTIDYAYSCDTNDEIIIYSDKRIDLEVLWELNKDLRKEERDTTMITKKDLRSGMIVLTREGDCGVVMVDLGVILLHNGYIRIRDYSDSLICEESAELDIVKIYSGQSLTRFDMGLAIDITKQTTPIWTRIDWKKLPSFTKVKCRIGEGHPWENAYFLEWVDGNFPFKATKADTFTYFGEDDWVYYKECKIHEDEINNQ